MVELVPWLGDRRAREAWREWFEDTYIIDFITGVTASKVLETLVVMTAPVVNVMWHLLWTDPLKLLDVLYLATHVEWEAAGELFLYTVLTGMSFCVSVFGWHLRKVAKESTEKVGDATEKVDDAIEKVEETVSGDGE